MSTLPSLSILYGTRKGAEDWQEEIITTDATRHEAAREWAKANGFDRFRVAVSDGSAPDFASTVNGTRRKRA